jgi:phosphohistidine swiveling domain-containing protein
MKKDIWLEFEWPGVHWYQVVPPMHAWIRDFGKYGSPLSKMVASYKHGTSGFYVIKEEYENSGKKFFEKVKKDPEIMFKVLTKVEEAAKEIFRLGRKWQNIDLTRLTDLRLIKTHQELFKWDEQLWQKGQIQNLLELHNSYLSQYTKEVIGKNFLESEINEIFKILTTSTYHTITERQDEGFLKLLTGSTKKDLFRHYRKYTWMTYGWAGPALDLEYFIETLREARKNKKIVKELKLRINERKALLVKQKEILKKFDPTQRRLALILRAILESKAIRVDAHSMTYFTGERLLAEIGKRLDLSLNQMRVVESKNVPRLFKGYDVNQINNEYNLVVYFSQGGKLTKLTGKAAKGKYAYAKSKIPKVKPANEIRGELAYAGKIRGRVRLILDIKDGHKFKQGEILVSRITDPSYVPLMKKASAIVTDVGGITSHAAIVSRELHKICIVGTNIGTKVLKDGDLVEVDADKGIVRKVGR